MQVHYCCGSFYATTSRLFQLIKMGVNPFELFVVDEDEKRLGWLALNKIDFSQDHINIICFDDLIERMNNEYPDNCNLLDNNIFTVCGEKNLYSKYNQINLVNTIDSDLIVKQELLKLPSDMFVRLDRDHGGKHANLLKNHVKCNDSDYVVITDQAGKEFVLSITASIRVSNNKLKSFDITISNSKFKDYSDMYTYTTVSENKLNQIKYSAYIPGYNERIHIMPKDMYNTLYNVFESLVDVFKIQNGIVSTELFSTPNFDKFFYIETNFRDGDLELACCPNVYNYYRDELISRGAI